MGTRWRGLLAPLGVSTGDGRRFREDGVSHRQLPLPLKWQRSDVAAHDESVVIGSFEQINMGTVTEAVEAGWIGQEAAANLDGDMRGVWGGGELFDDVDPAEMPRLAEDVAEARTMLERRVVGPSVDAGAAEAVLAEVGSDEPISEERLDELLEAAWESGEDPPIELLFTEYEIAAATLVTVPAFAECRPFELIPAEPADGEDDSENAPADAAAVHALVAAAGVYGTAELFTDPQLPALTPITVGEPDERGVRRLFGHVAAFGTCHTGYRDTCVTPPTSARGYADFHRYLTTSSGVALPAPAGRITVAHGQLTGACACCRGIDDHACQKLSAGATIAHYDRARTAGYVCAGEDEHGIWVAGVVAPEADERDLAALARRQVSGDWREISGGLELVEVLALSRERPGFPLPHTRVQAGRQVTLVAAGTVRPGRAGSAPAGALSGLDYRRIGQEVARQLAPTLSAALAPAQPPTPPPPPPPVPAPVESSPQPEPTPAASAAAPAGAGIGELAALIVDVDTLTGEGITAATTALIEEVTRV